MRNANKYSQIANKKTEGEMTNEKERHFNVIHHFRGKQAGKIFRLVFNAVEKAINDKATVIRFELLDSEELDKKDEMLKVAEEALADIAYTFQISECSNCRTGHQAKEVLKKLKAMRKGKV